VSMKTLGLRPRPLPPLSIFQTVRARVHASLDWPFLPKVDGTIDNSLTRDNQHTDTPLSSSCYLLKPSVVLPEDAEDLYILPHSALSSS
jgi:hypothetical protein